MNTYADEIETWLRSNGAMYLTTARHAIRWPTGASAAEVTIAIERLITEGRVVIIESGITGPGLRIPNVWPEWVERVERGSFLDLSTRITIGRCCTADAQAVPA